MKMISSCKCQYKHTYCPMEMINTQQGKNLKALADQKYLQAIYLRRYTRILGGSRVSSLNLFIHLIHLLLHFHPCCWAGFICFEHWDYAHHLPNDLDWVVDLQHSRLGYRNNSTICRRCYLSDIHLRYHFHLIPHPIRRIHQIPSLLPIQGSRTWIWIWTTLLLI